MTACIGIDLGVEGAIVELGPDGLVLNWWDMPVLAVPGPRRGGKPTIRHDYDVLALAEILRTATAGWDGPLVVLERLTPMPSHRRGRDGAAGRDGVEAGRDGERRSNPFTDFALGEAGGIVRGICAALSLRLERVYPITWRTRMLGSVVTPSDLSPARRKAAVKAAGLVRAREMFPVLASALTRARDSGRADAALLAEYGRRFVLQSAVASR